MESNLVIQYTIVAALLTGAVIWLFVKGFKKNNKRDAGGCCGCSLSRTCNKSGLKQRSRDNNESCRLKHTSDKQS